MKSLIDVAKNNELPIKVVADTGTIYILIALGKDNTAYTHTEKNTKSLIMRTADKKQWKIWTEPAPVPHWPALRNNGKTGSLHRYELSNALYATEESGRVGVGHNFIRLCTEYPVIMLAPKA